MQEIPIWQRLLACLVYLLPWSHAIEFGGPLISIFPALRWLQFLALPLISVQTLIPLGGFVMFLLLYSLVARNPKVPYLIRFNALQAILLSIVLVVISYAFQSVLVPLMGIFLLKTLSNTIFLGCVALFGFVLVQCLRGKDADIPPLSEAVRMQLM